MVISSSIYSQISYHEILWLKLRIRFSCLSFKPRSCRIFLDDFNDMWRAPQTIVLLVM
jgi:hypothetical protein